MSSLPEFPYDAFIQGCREIHHPAVSSVIASVDRSECKWTGLYDTILICEEIGKEMWALWVNLQLGRVLGRSNFETIHNQITCGKDEETCMLLSELLIQCEHESLHILNSVLMLSIVDGHMNNARAFIARGADMNSSENFRRKTPLEFFTLRGNEGAIRRCMELTPSD